MADNTFSIASWNVNSLKVRLSQVLDWLAANPVDVLGLQETKLTDDKFPQVDLQQAGYHVVFSGQPTYNGVALLSREPATDVLLEPPNLSDEQRRIIAASYGDIRVINLYVVNGKAVGDEKYSYKMDWLQRVHAWLAEEVQRHQKLLVIGDFNIAPGDEDVHDPQAWHEQILCSTPEREQLQAMLDLGLQDTFRLFQQPPQLYSWWDYRQAGFRRNLGLRIDLILASVALAEKCISSSIDKEPRRLERPSDHAPVMAVFERA
ncbi:MAG: exodeoxyribonuclease III [Gammaproteobacteria bacterium]|nr:exodeoxyribonuclease III [Gammaproteobacteria bacterium]